MIVVATAVFAEPIANDTANFELPVAVALANATRKVSEEPNNSDHWGHLGKLMHAHEMYERAAKAYDKASELDPQEPAWLYLSGVASQHTDPNRAIQRLQACLDAGLDQSFVLLRLAQLLDRSGNPQQAQQHYEATLNSSPKSVHALVGLARLDMRKRKFNSALTRLQRAREIGPSHGPIYPLMAQALSYFDRNEEARFAEILTLTFDQPIPMLDPLVDQVKTLGLSSNALTNRGLRLAAQGKLKEAETLFRRVMDLRKGQVRDSINLGIAIARQNRTDEAIDVFQSAREFAPDHVGLLANLGLALMQKGQIDSAEKTIARALDLDPDHPDALFNMAGVHVRKRQFDEVISLLSHLLELNPGILEARYNLGAAFAAMENFEKATEEWELLSKLKPDDANLLFHLGSAYVRLGQMDKAVSAFGRGRDADPRDPRSQRALETLGVETED